MGSSNPFLRPFVRVSSFTSRSGFFFSVGHIESPPFFYSDKDLPQCLFFPPLFLSPTLLVRVFHWSTVPRAMRSPSSFKLFFRLHFPFSLSDLLFSIYFARIFLSPTFRNLFTPPPTLDHGSFHAVSQAHQCFTTSPLLASWNPALHTILFSSHICSSLLLAVFFSPPTRFTSPELLLKLSAVDRAHPFFFLNPSPYFP